MINCSNLIIQCTHHPISIHLHNIKKISSSDDETTTLNIEYELDYLYFPLHLVCIKHFPVFFYYFMLALSIHNTYVIIHIVRIKCFVKQSLFCCYRVIPFSRYLPYLYTIHSQHTNCQRSIQYMSLVTKSQTLMR